MRAGKWEQTEQASIACQETLMNFNTSSHCLRRAGKRKRRSYSEEPLQEQLAFFSKPPLLINVIAKQAAAVLELG